MSVRKVLAPLVGGPKDGATLFTAITLSKDLKAHLEACFVRPDPEDAMPYLGLETGDLEEVRQEYRHHAEVTGKELAAKSHRQFNAACKKNGVAKSKRPSVEYEIGAHWVEVVGRAAREIPEAAKLCDLTVFAGPLADYSRLIPNVLECTLLGSGSSILFAPNESVEYPPAQVAIAWDASVQAVRVNGAATAFLQVAKQILVLSAEETNEETADPQRLIEYLAWRGTGAEDQVLKTGRGAMGPRLLTAAHDFGADFMVMSGYAHNRFDEAVFGGTTLHVIRHAQIPLVMMH